MADNVIQLDFRDRRVAEETIGILACKACRNKTYTLTLDQPEHFPLLRCAACGDHMGRMGWWHDDDPGTVSA